MLGEAIGRQLRGGERIGLSGDLGAGKTQLVRGLARGLDLDPELIYSPSFTLVAEHAGRIGLCHIDLFRLGERVGQGDAYEIGLDEYLASSGVTVIEGYRKLDGETAKTTWTLEIAIDLGAGDRRTIRIEGTGGRAEEILAGLAGLAGLEAETS